MFLVKHRDVKPFKYFELATLLPVARCLASEVGYGCDELPSHILEHLGHVEGSFGSHALR